MNPQCAVPGCNREAARTDKCHMHYLRWLRRGDVGSAEPEKIHLPIEQRLWARVDKNGPNGCWLWTGAKASGYGRVSANKKSVLAHRVAYELLVGPVPEGMQLDHLCRNPACVNPSHLEPVSDHINKTRIPRPTHCPSGHEFTPENTWITKANGWRMCRECSRIRSSEYYYRKKRKGA